ncbi:16S rRNA (cytosine967-C5)-methyltransferase [Ruegeria halocynthiae]|uniref:16S rRNA (Cytosine967-C5)-methyltransferase n=1 Tax=Ruegeria halocynthiae TaxID=985054 RepID=A0A1H2T6R9_9RHOB|nr:RsmB/NOP family class I SAM-dependent RNA methyltransferase [Ruegeria halocynthiae]SDW39571.1 16S rRNA (cytosine967-C5)-methyltransferase [Ruegeria halocynthiae]
MTPAARVQASIEILDDILSGAPVEKALTGWARRSRFAGSKDRAAIRDHVFDALRCRRSFAAYGGSETGRGLMIGAVRSAEGNLADVFTGARYAPAQVTEAEKGRAFQTDAERLDIPEWLWPSFQAALKDEAEPAANSLQSRAPVHLRVNLAKADLPQAMQSLSDDGIQTHPHPACDTALEVTEGARRISHSQAYANGIVELQDAASQAVIAALELRPAMRVLDYCAGGGGKTLALAARAQDVQVFAHDANPDRMRDLPARTKRAGAEVTILTTDQVADQAPFDVVLIDVPCSGSGSWRRAPAGKWALTPDGLDTLTQTQASIMRNAAPLVAEKGVFVYATCSMLTAENDGIVDDFLSRHPSWHCGFRKTWLVSEGTDGFYSAHLTRD